MRRNEEKLLAGLFVVLIGIGLFVFYYFDTMPGSPLDPVKVRIVATPLLQNGPASVFLPLNFTVTEGQHVSLTFVNQDDSPHELVIPGLSVTTGIVNAGGTARVTFIPDQVGRFVFGQPTSDGLLSGPGPLSMNGTVTVLAP